MTDEQPRISVQACSQHTEAYVDGCQDCTAEVQAMDDLMQGLVEETQKRQEGLARAGMAVPPYILHGVILDVLVDALFRDPKNRLRFATTVQGTLIDFLKQTQSQVSQQEIAPQQKLTVVRNGMPRPR